MVRDLLAPHLDAGDTVTVIDRSLACPPSLTYPLLRRLIDDNQLEVRAKFGWTDVARFAEYGIPATNFGSGDPEVSHTRDEHVHRARVRRMQDERGLYERQFLRCRLPPAASRVWVLPFAMWAGV